MVVASMALTGRAEAATWIVDNQASNCSNSAANAGSPARPYCTITRALNDHHAPGDTILVRRGVYLEKVTVPGSGAPDMPIVLHAQGADVVVDGADPFDDPALWSAGPVDSWLAASVTWAPAQVFVDSVRLAPSTASPSQLPPQTFTWVSGVGLYVNLGGGNPGTHRTLVGHRSYAFHAIARSWITVEGFEIRHTESRSIFFEDDCTDVVIARNHITWSDSYGIELVDGVRIRIEQNVVSDGNYHGIGLTAGSHDCLVRDNESFRNADPDVRRANGIYVYGSHDNTFVDNRLHHNQDSGMFFTTGSDHNVSCNNRSWLNGDHGFDHVDAVGSVHSNDVAYGNYRDGFSIEGNSPQTQIHNSIAIDNGLTTNEFDMWVNDLSSIGFVSDYNILWNSTNQTPFKFINTQYRTMADYQGASGQDLHSLQGDPLFVDAAAGNFYLLPGSPAIDAGCSAVPAWPESDAVGGPRVDQCEVPDRGAGPVTYADIGALEFEQQVDPDFVELPNPIVTAEDRPPRRPPIVAGTPAAPEPGAGFALSAGRPNPSRGSVDFTLDLDHEAPVQWEVFDLAGRRVAGETRSVPAGRTILHWNGRRESGETVAPGVYLVRAASGGRQVMRRVVRI